MAFKGDHRYLQCFPHDDPQRWLRSPGQRVSQLDNDVNRSGPVCIRNQAHIIAVEFQHALSQVECF
jgi:hypothetical protein